MLTEIALTPHAFQPPVRAKEWADQLRALNQRLLHYASQCPLIFSNLNDGPAGADWLTTIDQSFAKFKPAEHRTARDLLDRIRRSYLVSRPSQQQVRVAAKEDQWVKEAIRPAPNHPIDQIVTSWDGVNACRKAYTKVLGLNELDGAVFWNGITVSASPTMSIDDQVKMVRPVWLHGQVLSVVLPYALETPERGEANWFFAFASHAFSRPAGHGEPVVELHVSFDGNGAEVMQQGVAHRDIARFIQQAQRQSGLRGHQFSLVVRARSHGSQRFITRRLFAGEETNIGTTVPEIRVRWGIALEHVALLTDAAKQTPPTFTLLPRQQADDQFRFECRSAGPRLLGPIPVQC